MVWYAPDSILLEVLEEGAEGDKQENLEDAQQGKEEAGHGGTGIGQGNGHSEAPLHVREQGHGRMGGLGSGQGCGGLRNYDLDPPGPPNILNQLVAILHDAGLQANP